MASLGACQAFLPARGDSEFRDDEKIAVVLSPSAPGDLAPDPGSAFAPEPFSASIAVAALVGLAVDAAAEGLEREADRYSSEYIVVDSFAGSTWAESLPGQVAVTRTVKQGDALEFRASFEAVELRTKTGADMVGAGFYVMRMNPTELKILRSRAKVLSDDPFWWLLPTTWFGKLFREGSHQLEIDIDVVVDASWWDSKSRKMVTQTMDFSLSPMKYDMDKDEVVGAMPKSAWQGPIPVGAFLTARVAVTEKDSSNAAEYLNDAAKAVRENRSKIVDFAVDQSGGD